MARRTARVADDDDDDVQDMVAYNAGVSSFAKLYGIHEIQQTEFFKNILPYSEVRVNELAESINTEGYDPFQAIHIWINCGSEKPEIIDGNTRYEAAVKAGLYQIPCYEHKFDSQEEAAKYVLAHQLSRRNLGPQEMITIIDKYLEFGGGRKMQDIRKELVDKLNISDRQVQKIMAISQDEEARDAVKDGASIHQAYDDLMNRKHPERMSKTADDCEENNAEIPDTKESSSEEDWKDYEGYEAEKRRNNSEGESDFMPDGCDGDEEDESYTDTEDSPFAGVEAENPVSVGDNHAEESLPADGRTEVKQGKPVIQDDPSFGSNTYIEADLKQREHKAGWDKCLKFILAQLYMGDTIENIWEYFNGDNETWSASNIYAFELTSKVKNAYREFDEKMRSR